MSTITPAPPASLSMPPVVELARASGTDVPVTTGNHAQLFVDEHQAMPAILDAIKGAKQQVNVAMFSWQPSGMGKQVADALVAKAREGVQVNIQIDQVGSLQVPGSKAWRYFDNLARQGINLVRNERVSMRDGLEPVDHRKLYVIDGRTAFTGGMNLSGRYDGWHDVMARFDGPAAAQAGETFLTRWKEEGGKVTPAMRDILKNAQPIADAKHAVTILSNRPGVVHEATNHLISSINNAKSRVWVETPYMTDPRAIKALINAAKRGVETRVLLPGTHDKSVLSKTLHQLATSWYPDLTQAGVQLYEQPQMSHAKISLVDDEATVGSMNFTRRATIWDHELNAAVTGGTFVQEIESLFQRDVARSDRVTRAEARKYNMQARARRMFDLKY